MSRTIRRFTEMFGLLSRGKFETKVDEHLADAIAALYFPRPNKVARYMQDGTAGETTVFPQLRNGPERVDGWWYILKTGEFAGPMSEEKARQTARERQVRIVRLRGVVEPDSHATYPADTPVPEVP